MKMTSAKIVKADHNNKFGNKVVLVNNAAFKDETPHKVLFGIT